MNSKATNVYTLNEDRLYSKTKKKVTLINSIATISLSLQTSYCDPSQSKGYSRVITPTQFGRILHFLTLKVAPEDFKLLCRKFADRATGDVNYPAFVQCVDQGAIKWSCVFYVVP